MRAWALDLDGVVWNGHAAIEGSVATVNLLLERGDEVVYVTNNSFATVAEQEAKMVAAGIVPGGSFVSSAMAGASLIDPSERVVVLGGPGIVEAVERRGGVVIDAGPADAVMVGLDWNLSYERLRAACTAVMGGARFIATNRDPTYPTEFGQWPGGGALVAAVEAATGVSPEVAGKPHRPQIDLVHERIGADGVMVGDRPDTDGRFAEAMGVDFALVLSGVTTADMLPVIPAPRWVGQDLADVVAQVLREA